MASSVSFNSTSSSSSCYDFASSRVSNSLKQKAIWKVLIDNDFSDFTNFTFRMKIHKEIGGYLDVADEENFLNFLDHPLPPISVSIPKKTPKQEVFSNHDFFSTLVPFLDFVTLDRAGKVCRVWNQKFSPKLYPFHQIASRRKASAQDIEECRILLDRFRNMPYFRSETRVDFLALKYFKCTPATRAFKEGKYELTEFFIQEGGHFQAEECCDSRLYDPSQCLDVHYPVIYNTLREARWNFIKDCVDERRKFLQKILESACDSNNLQALEWLLEKCKTIDSVDLQLFVPLQKMIQGGFDELLQFAVHLDFSSLTAEEKDNLIKLAIDLGYPHIALLLEPHGFTISDARRTEINKTMVRLREIENTLEMLEKVEGKPLAYLASPPTNLTHFITHGGSSNEAIYQREFRKGVAWALLSMEGGDEKKPGHYRRILESLAYRRHRQAVLGKNFPVFHFGRPQPAFENAFTSFNSKSYGIYRERALQSFPGGEGGAVIVPIQVKVGKESGTFVLEERHIRLTHVSKAGWTHPAGANRDLILDEVDRLCNELDSGLHIDQRDLVSDVLDIYYLISHAAPWIRGTPTITAMAVTALWLRQLYLPPNKMDWNCEALVHSTAEKFKKDILSQLEFPLRSLSDFKISRSWGISGSDLS